jgi:D-alanyl-D-alanine carboxypeptidase (penicillin-binding protein 5/6)
MRRFFAVFLLSLLAALPAAAKLGTNAEHAVLMDGNSGQVLWQKDGYVPMPPASMSKLMTLELVFQRLKDGRLKLTDTFPVSKRAWSTQGSKMFVAWKSQVPIEALIQGVIVDSGNDACIVLAEGIGGTVENFVTMMNQRAKQLGLTQSHFVNPDGLPDPPGQLMSANDRAKLARHLIYAYPAYYHYFSEKSFTWSNITQPNRDQVINDLPGADGLKTGHIEASGYGIVASAKQNGERLILVLNGLRYPDAKNDYFPNIYRAQEAARILKIAFREFRTYPIYKSNQVIGQVPVLNGAKNTIAVTAGKPLAVMMQVDAHGAMKVALHSDPNLRAPVKQGQKVGTLRVNAPDFPGLTVPVYAAETVEPASIFRRAWTWGISLLPHHKK